MNAETVVDFPKAPSVHAALAPPCREDSMGASLPSRLAAVGDPGPIASRRLGPRLTLVGELLEKALQRRRAGETIRTLAAAFGTSKSAMARRIAGVYPDVRRSTDPRRRVQGLVRRGRLPGPGQFRCCDCRAASCEYDIVVKDDGGLRLAPLCRSCNRRRARRRRVGLQILESGRRLLVNVGQRGAALPGGQNHEATVGQSGADVGRGTCAEPANA